jgi:hypothetical protein
MMLMYTFDIIGVSPVLYFFNQQQDLLQRKLEPGVEYLSSQRCTLDALLESAETVTPKHNWNFDEVVDTVVSFWMKNSDTIQHWKSRLKDAGHDSILVSRLADIQSLKNEFESLFDD